MRESVFETGYQNSYVLETFQFATRPALESADARRDPGLTADALHPHMTSATDVELV